MTVGQKIRIRRKELGMTQKQLGELCGMADSAIRKYESGKVVPKQQTLEKISAALQLPAYALSFIENEVDIDGSGVSIIDLSQVGQGVREKLALTVDDPNCRIGIAIKDDGERKALEYLVSHEEDSPAWIERLVVAFGRLSFQRQQMLISAAEFWCLEHQFMKELEANSKLMPQITEE